MTINNHSMSLALIVSIFALSGCKGGASTEKNAPGATTAPAAYSGPAPGTDDVQAFRINVWDNLNADNRCGACHNEGGQTPQFVRMDDVNLAYAAANTITDLGSAADSRMVTKVGGGHNCWLSSDSACAAVITAFIEAWAGDSAAGGTKVIQLVAPVLKDPGATKTFPDDSSAFATTVWPVLTANCASCHSESVADPQSPFFAGSDVDVAYDAAKAKIDLNNPANSRLVLRLRDEFHNCWTDCGDNANTMEMVITNLAATIAVTGVDPAWVLSKALALGDGVVASGGSRYESDQIALWEFKTGLGNTAFDTSGVEPGLHLFLSGNVDWVGGWGINIVSGKAQGSTTDSKKLHDLITATGEYSIEAWVIPANVTQEGPARIISYSAGTTARNFTLGQTLYNYDYLLRSSVTDGNGEPSLSTDDDDEDLQATLQHVVVNYDPVNGRRIFVNGEFTGDIDAIGGGNLSDWDDSFAFVLGNEVSGDRQWQGILRMVAIHNRVLTPAQIQQNLDIGVGEKFFLLFSVSHLISVPDSYILFEVSQYDSYSYLFSEPTFISLDATVAPSGIPLQAMRIGINGKEAVVGQAFRNLDVTLGGAQYTAALGQPLSRLGTVIALENGPDSDEFFLTFELLGSNVNVVTEPAPLPPATPADLPAAAAIGLRTFDEINATMAALTGVSATEPNVLATYTTVRQQLPTAETFVGFLSAHQVAISQLSIEYCNALVEDAGLRTGYFPGFSFGLDVATAFGVGDSIEKNIIINSLYDNMLGLPGALATDLTSAPTRAQIKAELSNSIDGDGDFIGDGLFDRMTSACPAGCDAVRTRTIVKAMCSAVIGSAATLLQ